VFACEVGNIHTLFQSWLRLLRRVMLQFPQAVRQQGYATQDTVPYHPSQDHFWQHW